MKRVKWQAALVLFIVFSVLFTVVHFVNLSQNNNNDFGLMMAVLMLLAYIAASVYMTILHYRCWTALPERFRCTTPGRAVGFLFIPLYNIHWAFVSYEGLAKGQNLWAAERGDTKIRDMTTLSTVYSILYIVGYITILPIPVFPVLLVLSSLVVFILLYRGYVANANRILAVA